MLTESELKDARRTLDKYYELYAKIDKLPVADALEELKSVAEDLVEFITDIVYPE